jgi:hypothetical protein
LWLNSPLILADTESYLHFDFLKIIYDRFILNNENLIKIFHWNKGKILRIPVSFTSFIYKIPGCPDNCYIYIISVIYKENCVDICCSFEKVCFLSFVYTCICIAVGDSVIKRGGDLINWFNPAILLCLS